MKSFNFILAVLSGAVIFFTSCKKDSNNTKTKTDFLVQGSWKFDNATVSGTDVSSLILGCQKDNTITFSLGGAGTLDEGATRCNASDSQTRHFTWSLTANETLLHVNDTLFTGGSSDFNVGTLDDNQLVLSQNINIMGTLQPAVVTFKH